MKKAPILIVGNGLAACHLAWQLHGDGAPVRMIGHSGGNCASETAAGVLNPVTGKRLARSWRIESLLPAARERYRELEQALEITCLHDLEIRRYCLDDRDVESHAGRINDPAYAGFLGPLEAPGSGSPAIDDRFGSFTIRKVGYVELPSLLHAMRAALQGRGAFEDAAFDYGRLRVSSGQIRYGDETLKAVVFCEGSGISRNPWFSWLPFRPVKGEILTVRSDAAKLPPAIYHHRKWVLPLGGGRFRIGSTYERGHGIDPLPTDHGREELLRGFQALFKLPAPAEVTDHRAGIRPCTRDTRPYLGRHPEIPGLFVFNGLGSKGALLAPFLSRHLCDHLLKGDPIDPEVDCARCRSFMK